MISKRNMIAYWVANLCVGEAEGSRERGPGAVVLFPRCRWQVEGGTGRAGRGDGARAARVALSPESRAARNACIIIMTDADRAAAPLICAAFDLAARAGLAPAAQTSRPLTFIRSDAALPVVRPFALALNRGFYLVNSGSATVRGAARGPLRPRLSQWCACDAQYGVCCVRLLCRAALLPPPPAMKRRRGQRRCLLSWITWTLCVR